MKKIILHILFFVLVLGILPHKSKAQQGPIYTQYIFNPLNINPAYAGSREALSINGVFRKQWTGFSGAPNTQAFSIHSPLIKDNLGIGFEVLNDQVNTIKQNYIAGNISYSTSISENAKLSFGVKFGASSIQAGLSDLIRTDFDDDVLSQNINSGFLPNFGAGVYLSNKKYFVGISVPKIMENDFKDLSTSINASETRQLYFTAGYVFPISKDVLLRSIIVSRYESASPLAFDVNATIILKNKMHFGAFIRPRSAAGGLIQYYFTDQFRLGYAYDYSLEIFNGFKSATHEIVVSYDFKFNKGNVVSPRYF